METVTVIDVGNTRSKWAQLNAISAKPIASGTFDNDPGEDLLGRLQGGILVLASVGPVQPGLERAMSRAKRVVRIDHSSAIPLKLDYRTPETLGMDRLANAVAAHVVFPQQNVLVVDAGTCITYDLISAEGTYHGGAISPGLGMRAKALNNYTHGLPLVPVSHPVEWPGKSTEQSIQCGVLHGATLEVKGFIEQAERDYPALKTVLTGGDLQQFEHALKNETFADAFFTLRGLYAIHLYNERKA